MHDLDLLLEAISEEQKKILIEAFLKMQEISKPGFQYDKVTYWLSEIDSD